MRSRMVREGSVGLLILAGLGVFGIGIAWFQGLNPANRSFTITANFSGVEGVQSGSPVRYRGVAVGRIIDIRPGPTGVDVKMSIAPADLLIPADVSVSIDQSGLLGENVVNIVPKTEETPQVAANPLDADCDRQIILCDGSTVDGRLGINTNALIKSTITFAELYGQPEFYGNLNDLTKNFGKAATEISSMSKEISLLARSLRQRSRGADAIGDAARQTTITVKKIGVTVDQLNALLAENRSNLASTLDNISQTSATLKVGVRRLDSTFDRFNSGSLISDLETVSANAAATSENLKSASQTLNDPATIASLQQTLDAARSAFQNAQKITADLDEITGDPEIRKQLKNLIRGLGGLLASSQEIQQRVIYAQQLEPAAAELALEADAIPAPQSQKLSQRQLLSQPLPGPSSDLINLRQTAQPSPAATSLKQSQRILPPVLYSKPGAATQGGSNAIAQ